MSNAQHTPTPWNEDGRAVIGPCEDQEICVCTADGVDRGDEHDEGEIVVSEAEAYANAAFIVRACNSHDALVMVARLVADIYESEQARGNFPAGQTWGTIDHTVGQAARAALALAKENRTMKKLTASAKADARKRHQQTIAVFERAESELPGFNKHDRPGNLMDLDSLNEGEVVMDWAKFLAAPAFDFAHDLYGIHKHMDRTTWPGVLTDCFLPRCTMSDKQRLKLAKEANTRALSFKACQPLAGLDTQSPTRRTAMTTYTLRLHALAALARAYADQAEARSLTASRSAHHAAAHAAPHAPLLARRAEKARATARHRAIRAQRLESLLGAA